MMVKVRKHQSCKKYLLLESFATRPSNDPEAFIDEFWNSSSNPRKSLRTILVYFNTRAKFRFSIQSAMTVYEISNEFA